MVAHRAATPMSIKARIAVSSNTIHSNNSNVRTLKRHPVTVPANKYNTAA